MKITIKLKINKIESKSVSFVLALLQADLKEDTWMQLPIGFQVEGQTETDSDCHFFSNWTRIYMA